MILIEGSDNLGKSTLAEKICTRLGTYYTWFGKEMAGTSIDEYKYQASNLEWYVVDRFHTSEFIYGPPCRAGSKLDLQKCLEIDRYIIEDLKGFIIIVSSESYHYIDILDKYQTENQDYSRDIMIYTNGCYKAYCDLVRGKKGYLTLNVFEGFWPSDYLEKIVETIPSLSHSK